MYVKQSFLSHVLLFIHLDCFTLQNVQQTMRGMRIAN